MKKKRNLLITLTRVYAHDATRACVCVYMHTYARTHVCTYARVCVCVCVYTRVHIHMKEISRKCLIFPGSSSLIKSWKKSLLEVLNACDYELEGRGGGGEELICVNTTSATFRTGGILFLLLCANLMILSIRGKACFSSVSFRRDSQM